jgi:hypothetical protein
LLFSYFSGKVLRFCPELAWTAMLLSVVSFIARVTGVHHTQLIGWDEGLTNFLPWVDLKI